MEICKLTAGEVAKVWMDSESLYYRTAFAPSAKTRLTAVIQRARNDGQAIATAPLWQWLLVGLAGAVVGHFATILYFLS